MPPPGCAPDRSARTALTRSAGVDHFDAVAVRGLSEPTRGSASRASQPIGRPHRTRQLVTTGDYPTSKYPVPPCRNMLLSIGVRSFSDPWMLTIRFCCGRERQAPPPAIARLGLGAHEARKSGDVVRRLRCQECGGRPINVFATPDPSSEGMSCWPDPDGYRSRPRANHHRCNDVWRRDFGGRGTDVA